MGGCGGGGKISKKPYGQEELDLRCGKGGVECVNAGAGGDVH